MAKPTQIRIDNAKRIARLENGTMAKRGERHRADRDVLLALKTELWQSQCYQDVYDIKVLLALKTELWQSSGFASVGEELYCSPGKLNYGKAEDKESYRHAVYCSPGKLNYGKAIFSVSSIYLRIARLENGTMAKPSLGYVPGGLSIARLENGTMAKPLKPRQGRLGVLLALKTELWQSIQLSESKVDDVLLALKTELWQSGVKQAQKGQGVLLALKTELWQSNK